MATDAWSDWSLVPVTEISGQSGRSTPHPVTIQVRREQDGLGRSLWIYQLLFDADGNEVGRVPLRECNWVFADEDGVEVEIAAYAARPAEGSGPDDALQVQFENAWYS